jgi:hypothetical protein
MVPVLIFLVALSGLLAIAAIAMVREQRAASEELASQILLELENLNEMLERAAEDNNVHSKSSTVAEDNKQQWSIYLRNHFGKGWK